MGRRNCTVWNAFGEGGPSWNLPFPNSNLTAAEIIAYLPLYLKSVDVIDRFVINGGTASHISRMVNEFRFQPGNVCYLHVKKHPSGDDALDLTRCVRYALDHPKQPWLFPEDFGRLVKLLRGPKTVIAIERFSIVAHFLKLNPKTFRVTAS